MPRYSHAPPPHSPATPQPLPGPRRPPRRPRRLAPLGQPDRQRRAPRHIRLRALPGPPHGLGTQLHPPLDPRGLDARPPPPHLRKDRPPPRPGRPTPFRPHPLQPRVLRALEEPGGPRWREGLLRLGDAL